MSGLTSDLIDSARRRLPQTKRRTRHVDLRRVISDAYYALFHSCAELCADELIGKRYRLSDEWVLAYRAIEHGQTKKRMKAASSGDRDLGVKFFAQLFVSLQELRHQADYDPSPPRYNRSSALSLIDDCEAAITGLMNANASDRRWLASFVVFKERQ